MRKPPKILEQWEVLRICLEELAKKAKPPASDYVLTAQEAYVVLRADALADPVNVRARKEQAIQQRAEQRFLLDWQDEGEEIFQDLDNLADLFEVAVSTIRTGTSNGRKLKLTKRHFKTDEYQNVWISRVVDVDERKAEPKRPRGRPRIDKGPADPDNVVSHMMKARAPRTKKRGSTHREEELQ